MSRRVVGVQRLAWGCAFSVLLGSGSVLAQTASQITPPSYSPPTLSSEAPLVLPESPSEAPPQGSEALSVTLGGVVVDGAAVPPAQMTELQQTLVGHSITVAQIFTAARALEINYARAGYPLMRVIVPAQEITNGATLRLRVVEGFIERVDVEQLPESVRGPIAATLAPLLHQPSIRMKDIERRLLLASDTPGVSLSSALAAGSKPGAVVLVVEAKHRMVTGFVSYDNTLSHSLGRNNMSIGLNLNSAFGLGESLYLRFSGLPNFGAEHDWFDRNPRNRALAGGLTVPLGHNGLSLNLEASNTRASPRHEVNQPSFASQFTRYAGRISYPFIRSRALTLVGRVSFDMQEEKIDIIAPIDLPISFDKQRIVRTAGIVRAYLPNNGNAQLQIEASFGLNALGARSAADANPLLPLSRQGADASFQKMTLDASIEQPVAQHLTLAAYAQGQTSFNQALTNAEQFGINSSRALSPLPSGRIQGDAGYALRGEVQAPFPLATQGVFASITPYAFGSTGGVRLEKPTFFERRTTTAHAYGLGLRFAGSAKGGSPGMFASLEYGRADVRGTSGESDRISVVFVGQF